GVDSDPSSEPSACSEIPIVENANVSTTSLKSNYTEGDSLIYSCQRGYIGRVTFVCDGKKWRNARNTKCSRKRCQLPEDIPNGRFVIINGTEFVYETTIKYICKTGYRMVSLMDTRTCLVEGWSNHLPHCEEIICPLPIAKDNLIVEGLPDYDDNPLKYGHQLKFTCNSVGLKLVGTNEITCGENGEWSHSFPKCEEMICELEEIRGVSVFGVPQNNAPIKFGHKLYFHCSQPDMVLIGSPEVTCSTEGKWSSSFPICEVRKGCGPPPPVEYAALAALQKSFYNHEERVMYHCTRLYTIDGNEFKTCVQGRWTGSVRCI
ncbi:complement factor H-like, partial [Clarias magur]